MIDLRRIACLFVAAPFAVACSDSGSGAGGAASTSSQTGTTSAASGSTSAATTSGSSSSTGMGPTLRVFVTSATFSGDFGGLPGTDAACQKAATDAALGGTWRAWTGGSAGTPDSRFTHGPNPYVLVGGAQIAADWTDLTDGTLAAPIDHDEHGAAVTATDLVWTGVSANGKSSQPNCNDWVGQTGTHYGSMHDTTSAWSDAGATYCPTAMPGRLFCFEQ